MASSISFRGLLSRQPALTNLTAAPTNSTMSTTRLLSTTSAALARSRGSSGKGGAPPKPKAVSSNRKNKGPIRSENYARVKILKQNMFSPAPPPLRMGRLRWLRHWTIDRAWKLFRRQQQDAALKERARMHAGMYNACEELRKTVGPGDRDEGYLYRVAMEKKGVWGLHGVPIEYARFQTDSPSTEPWNHGWTR
jgi:large subunit ribosomal protein L40